MFFYRNDIILLFNIAIFYILRWAVTDMPLPYSLYKFYVFGVRPNINIYVLYFVSYGWTVSIFKACPKNLIDTLISGNGYNSYQFSGLFSRGKT